MTLLHSGSYNLSRYKQLYWKKTVRCLTVLVVVTLIGACATIPVEDRERLRQEIIVQGDETIAALVSQNPGLQKSIDTSAGYFVGRLSAVKAPVIGGGKGIGVLYDNAQDSRTYMNVKRFDLGFGLATGAARALIIFDNREALDRFRGGIWKTALGMESSDGEQTPAKVAGLKEGRTLYIQTETGAALTAGARLFKLSVNEDLTDTGVSEVSMPNTGFKAVDQQGKDAPRKWTRKLPFLGQKVIDEGYDLPLPLGFGLTYVNSNQSMLLTDLQVGINGREEEPFTFVSFDNANARNDTLQLKLDAWLFPFMNVFAMVGKLEGEAPMDVVLDGNGMLDHLGITCGGPLTPACAALQNKTFTIPIEAPFSGTTYGLGTVLAGGWNNWFVAIPLNITYADMDTTETEGLAKTVTPRAGRVFNLENAGNLSLYGGGNYLDAELTIRGQVGVPGTNFTIDYTIEQQNKDKWNLLFGANWDINKHWSLMTEYNGFIGSRETVILSLTSRF
jgi:hypothetical protein